MTRNLKTRILNALRRYWSRSPEAISIMESRKAPRKKGPQGGARWRCVQCKQYFGARQVQKDHIEPIIPIGEDLMEMSWDTLISRIFCPSTNIQILCRECHRTKTTAENAERRKNK